MSDKIYRWAGSLEPSSTHSFRLLKPSSGELHTLRLIVGGIRTHVLYLAQQALEEAHVRHTISTSLSGHDSRVQGRVIKPAYCNTGAVDENQTRHDPIDSRTSPSGELYGIKLGAGRENRTPLSAAWKAGVTPCAYLHKKRLKYWNRTNVTSPLPACCQLHQLQTWTLVQDSNLRHLRP